MDPTLFDPSDPALTTLQALTGGNLIPTPPSLKDAFDTGLAAQGIVPSHWTLAPHVPYTGDRIARAVGNPFAPDRLLDGFQKGQTYAQQTQGSNLADFQANMAARGLNGLSPSAPPAPAPPVLPPPTPPADPLGDAIRGLQAQLHALGQSPPKMEAAPKLAAPNLAQLGAAGLASLLAPKLALQSMAAPFQVQLQKNALDAQAVAGRNAQAQNAYNAKLQGLQNDLAFAQWNAEHPRPTAPSPLTMPPSLTPPAPNAANSPEDDSLLDLRQQIDGGDLKEARAAADAARGQLRGLGVIANPHAQATYDRHAAEAAQARDRAGNLFPNTDQTPANWKTYADALNDALTKAKKSFADLGTYRSAIVAEMNRIRRQLAVPNLEASGGAGANPADRLAALQQGLASIATIQEEQRAYATRLYGQMVDAQRRGRMSAPYGPPVPKNIPPKPGATPPPGNPGTTPGPATRPEPLTLLDQTMRPGEEPIFASAAATLRNPRYAGDPAVAASVGQALAQMLQAGRGESA